MAEPSDDEGITWANPYYNCRLIAHIHDPLADIEAQMPNRGILQRVWRTLGRISSS